MVRTQVYLTEAERTGLDMDRPILVDTDVLVDFLCR